MINKERFITKKIKPLFDQLHRDFIAKALHYYAAQDFGYAEFWRTYDNFLRARKNRKNDDAASKTAFDAAKKEFETIKTAYRKKIVTNFNLYAENWKIEVNQKLAEKYPEKYNKVDKKSGIAKGCLTAKGIEVLTEAGILEVLKIYLEEDKFVNEHRQLFSEEEKLEMLEGINFFDKFFTYFGPFNATRENLYKDDGTATAVATRIIDENLVRFCDNILLVQSDLKVGDKTFKPAEVGLDYNQEIFEITSFNKFVDQTGINSYNGGEKGDINLGLFSTLISKYIQDTFHQNKKLPFKNLYKIMLSEKTNWFEEETAESCIEILNEVNLKNQNWLPKLETNFQYIFANKNKDEVLEKIYLKKDTLSELSAKFFGGNNWFVLEEVIKDLGYTEKNYKNFLPVLALKQGLKSLSEGDYLSLKLTKKTKIKKANPDSLFGESSSQGFKPVDIFKPELLNEQGSQNSDLWSVFVDLWKGDFATIVEKNQLLTVAAERELLSLSKYEPLVDTNYTHTEIFRGETTSAVQTQANLAKLFLDSCMNLWQGLKMFELVKVVNRTPTAFYSDYETDENRDFYETVRNYFEDFVLFKEYDKIRNFSTKKPFSTSKFKINFENSTLLAGWDLNKEPDNTSIILKSPLGYELIVMSPKHNKLFDKNKNPVLYENATEGYKKMQYKLLPGPNKMLPKVAFADSNRALFQNIFAKYPKIERIRAAETFKKEKLIKEDLTTWIAFYQDILNTYPDWKLFNWRLKKPEDYEDVSKFYREVQIQGYQLSFVPVNNDILQDLEKEGKIYRFQIKNKDWNQFAKGSKNLQTIYWEQLFSPENLAQNILKLNGEAEIFQRPKTETLKLNQKVDRSGKLIFKGKTEQKVLKNERYLIDKMFFHVPLTINFSAQEITKYNDFLETNIPKEDLNYLGIDRGENHLLYYSLINSKGEIITQNTLNEFNGTDYERLLNQKQEDRKTAKDKWSVIGNIKDLKSGYLSLAVHEICKLAVENNALIVLENLNFGFKKSRTIKFEKSVYQKFEVALATKLQHLVFKDRDPLELGGVLKALQLAPKLEKVTDLDKADRWGIVRYVQASYTSRICPLTGWHKTVYLNDNLAEIKQKFNPEMPGFIQIGWDYNLKCYTFSYDCNLETLPRCTLYLVPEIIRTTYKDKFLATTKVGELHEEMRKLFARFERQDKDRLNEFLVDFEDREWKKLKYIFDQLCNIRVKVNNETQKIDLIQSPCPLEVNGEKIFFDSRQTLELAQRLGKKLPIDGDANGAYHIALSGLAKTNQKKP